MTTHNKVVLDLIEVTDKLLESIDENWSPDFKLVKKFATELRDELEEVLESHDSHE